MGDLDPRWMLDWFHAHDQVECSSSQVGDEFRRGCHGDAEPDLGVGGAERRDDGVEVLHRGHVDESQPDGAEG